MERAAKLVGVVWKKLWEDKSSREVCAPPKQAVAVLQHANGTTSPIHANGTTFYLTNGSTLPQASLRHASPDLLSVQPAFDDDSSQLSEAVSDASGLEHLFSSGHHLREALQLATTPFVRSSTARYSKYVGRHLSTFAGDGLIIYEMIGDIIESKQRELQQQVQRQLRVSMMPGDLITDYYMIGKRVRSAKPTILIWNSSAASRKRAKTILRKLVLFNEFDDWAILTSQFNAVLRQILPLRSAQDRETSHGYSLQKHNLYGALSTVSSKPMVNDFLKAFFKPTKARASVIAGSVRIRDQDYLVTTAHTFTGRTPFDGLSARREISLDSQKDSDKDEDLAYLYREGPDDDKQVSKLEHEFLRILKSSSAHTSASGSIGVSPYWIYVLAELQTLATESTRLSWHYNAIVIRQGSAELDYALLPTSSSITS